MPKLRNRTDREIRLEKIYADRAREAGIATNRAKCGGWRARHNLAADLAVNERALMQGLSRYFVSAMEDGQHVFFVTVCHPDWIRKRGKLSAALVGQVRAWLARRARRLSKHGQQRLVGAVDVAYNDKRAMGLGRYWCVHGHFLMAIPAASADDARALIRDAFNCPSDNRISRAVDVRALAGPEDVEKTLRYASGAFALHDENTNSPPRHRRLMSWTLGSLYPAKAKLPLQRRREFTRLMNELGPSKFWVLSGLRRRGNNIGEENSRVAQRNADISAMLARVDQIAEDWRASQGPE